MRKNILKAGLLLVLSACALVGCDDDEITSVDQLESNSSVITKTDDNDAMKNIYDNIMKSIYEGIHDGSLPSDTLEKALYRFAISVFGPYNEYSEVLNEGEMSLRVALTKDAASAEFKAFIDGHKVYQVLDSNNEIDYVKSKIKAQARFDSIENKIARKMYENIAGESYTFRHKYSESKFVRSLTDDMESVINGYESSFTTAHENILIDPADKKEDVFNKYLTRHFYGFDASYVYDPDEAKYTYIEEIVVPEIYKDLLTEQYVLEKSPSSLGRSYARKVNIVEISANSNYKSNLQYILNKYFLDETKEYSLLRNPDAVIPGSTDKVGSVSLSDFNRISNIVKGSGLNDTEVAILDSVVGMANSIIEKKNYEGETYTSGTEYYYEGTDFGDVVEKYQDIYKDSSKYATFSGSGAYSTATGLEIEKDHISLNNYVKTGWFVKSDLSSYSFSDQLFNLSVSTTIDKIKANVDANTGLSTYDRYSKDGANWVLGGRDRDYNKYVCCVNGTYFLKNSKNDPSNPNGDIVFKDGSKYYVVQIEEAISPTKLTGEVTKTLEDTKLNVLDIIADTGSYSTLAKEYWLEQMDFKFYDDDVYNHFKSSYPDIFDED